VKSQIFFLCGRCGNLVVPVVDKGGRLVCCGEEMRRLEPNTVEASREKHLPAVEMTDCGIRVKVGEAAHPMTAEHYIDFIYVGTDDGGRRAKLEVGGEPEARFCLEEGVPAEIYAYCNLHGLWKTEIAAV